MIRKIKYAIAILTTLLLVYLTYDYFQFKKQEEKSAFLKGTQTSTELRDNVNLTLKKVMKQGASLKWSIENSAFSAKQLDSLIISESNKNKTILGITVAFEPYAFSENRKLYAPYYDKNQNKILRLEKFYNYTDSKLKTSSWYTGVKTRGAHWVEPYYGEAAKALVSDYTLPFYYATGEKKGTIKGVVTMTISLKGFTKMIHALSLGKTGFGFVTSPNGSLLAYPINEYVGRKNIKDLISLETPEKLKESYKLMTSETSGNAIFRDALKNQETLFFFDTVPVSNWKIAVLFYKNDLLNNQDLYKRKYINIAFTISFLFLLGLAIFFARDYLSSNEIWYLSLLSTIILIANIILSGYLQHNNTSLDVQNESPPIADMTSLNTIVNAQQLKAKNLKTPLKNVVPTGIYVERLEFEDSYNVNISGVLWLKYKNDIAGKVTHGFKFPQMAPFAESSFIEEAYREQKKDYLLVGYNFRSTIRLNFDYSDYPFAKRNINLEIQPLKVTDNILLVPDLSSYTYTNPSQKIGVNKKIKLSGSKILETYYSYSFFTFNTNFGYLDNIPFQNASALHFNINVREVLITAFVTYLIPIFVTLIMMFILIYATPRSKNGKVDGGAIVQGMTAFFFVLVFSHIDLRKSIETSDLIYMEYFYFVTYAMIILATYNLITYSRIPHKIFDFRENLIVKATFWPLFLLMVLVITLFKFY